MSEDTRGRQVFSCVTELATRCTLIKPCKFVDLSDPFVCTTGSYLLQYAYMQHTHIVLWGHTYILCIMFMRTHTYIYVVVPSLLLLYLIYIAVPVFKRPRTRQCVCVYIYEVTHIVLWGHTYILSSAEQHRGAMLNSLRSSQSQLSVRLLHFLWLKRSSQSRKRFAWFARSWNIWVTLQELWACKAIISVWFAKSWAILVKCALRSISGRFTASVNGHHLISVQKVVWTLSGESKFACSLRPCCGRRS